MPKRQAVKSSLAARLTIAIVVVLAIVGCAPTRGEGETQSQTVASASNVAPVLGIVANEKLQIVELMKGGAAEAAGLQVGDTLIDLQWLRTLTPEAPATSEPLATPIPADAAPVLAGDSAGQMKPTEVFMSPEMLSPIAIPAPTIPPEEYMPTAAIPFTATMETIQLVAAGFPLKLRYQRDGQLLEMTIEPNIGVFQRLAPGEGTPTPVPHGYYWY